MRYILKRTVKRPDDIFGVKSIHIHIRIVDIPVILFDLLKRFSKITPMLVACTLYEYHSGEAFQVLYYS